MGSHWKHWSDKTKKMLIEKTKDLNSCPCGKNPELTQTHTSSVWVRCECGIEFSRSYEGLKYGSTYTREYFEEAVQATDWIIEDWNATIKKPNEQIKLEAKLNGRDQNMVEIYAQAGILKRNILWCVVHDDFFADAPDAFERLSKGETIKLTLQVDNPLDLE